MTDNPDLLIQSVQSALDAGDEDAAAARLADARDLSSPDAEQCRKLAVLARSIDRNDLAVKAIEAGPKSPETVLMTLQLRMELGEDVAGELTALPDSGRAGQTLLQLAGALYQEGRMEEAIARLADATGATPDWIVGHQLLSDLRWQNGEGLRAHRSYEEAVSRLPQNEVLWASWLAKLKIAGDWETFSRIAAAAQGRFRSSTLIAMLCADGFSEMGQEAEADLLFAALEEVIDADFDAARMRHAMRHARYEEAMAIGTAALARQGHGECWAWLGGAWCLSGDPRGQWFHRGTELIGTMDLDFGPGDLDALALALRRLHRGSAHPLGQSPRGGTQTLGPLLKRAEPEIRALRTRLFHAVRSYIDSLPPADGHPFLSRPRRAFRFEGAWSVLLRSAGHHVSHIHSHGWISSALYVDVPAGMPEAGDKAGWLGFGVPPLPERTEAEPVALLPPVRGRLVLFPAIFWHGTRPFADGERLTVAFDVVPR